MNNLSETRFRATDALNKVSRFHRAFGLPVGNNPQIPENKRAQMRLDLIREEFEELCRGVKNNNLVEIADAFSDLQYVLSGAILEFGLGDFFTDCFDEVHRSNMSKACYTKDEAIQTAGFYRSKGVQIGQITKREDRYYVYREDGKVLKSINYSEADLESVLLRNEMKPNNNHQKSTRC